MKKHKTIIIGAGVAGLGCARTLIKKDPEHDFIIISEDIGGRITTSEDGEVNYGAFFVLDSYRHIKEFATLRYRVNPIRVAFHDIKGKRYHLWSSLKHPIQMFRLYRIVREFEGHYEDFMKDVEHVGQKKALERHPELSSHYSQSARDYIKQAKIEDIAEDFVSEAVYSFSFVNLDQISALDLLRISTILIVPTYGFTFEIDNAIKGFEDKIIGGSVTGYKKVDSGYELSTKEGKEYTCENLVVATQPPVTKKLLGLPEIKPGANAYITHLRGDLLDTHKEDDRYNIYNTDGDIIAIIREQNGTFIFASLAKDTDLGQYFKNYEIIATKHWYPAFNLKISDVLYDADRGDNLYMIGDYNITGMEDSYITGIYAANRILDN